MTFIRVTSYEEAHELFRNYPGTSRRLCYKTTIQKVWPENTNSYPLYAVRLYSTDIIWYPSPDMVILNRGGFSTQLTNRRINDFTPAGIYVGGIRDHTSMLHLGGWSDGRKYPFRNLVVIHVPSLTVMDWPASNHENLVKHFPKELEYWRTRLKQLTAI